MLASAALRPLSNFMLGVFTEIQRRPRRDPALKR